jgi:hypothetical protein
MLIYIGNYRLVSTMKKVLLLGISLLIIAFLISIHHFVIAGRFFDMEDIMHHEFLLALFGGVGLGIIIGARLNVDR